MSTRTWSLGDEAATQAHAATMASVVRTGLIIYLHGDLGVGKTSWARGFVRAMGWRGSVKSPTYTLMETYELKGFVVHHLDLYRISDPQELEFLGLRDRLHEPNTIWLIEWPERGEGWLTGADLRLTLRHEVPPRVGRVIEISSLTPQGEAVLAAGGQQP